MTEQSQTEPRFRGLLKRFGYNTRERLNIHGSAFASYLASTAYLRYMGGNFTSDWREEALQWGLALATTWPISIPAAGIGYVFGIAGVQSERIINNMQKRKNLESQTGATN